MPDYTAEVSPRRVQGMVHAGLRRMENFRKARLMFLRNYVGPYYDQQRGPIGDEPINMIFNAIRVLVPNIVLSNPKHSIHTPYLAAREYAELLALALTQHDKTIRIQEVYRRVIVDAVFTLGIMKTGLASSGTVYALDETDHVDTGTVYTEAVDFDNFVVDPSAREHLFRDARFMGDRLVVPRRTLLDSGLYRNDLIEKLPACTKKERDKQAESLSKNELREGDEYDTEDDVEIIEIWVPSANALVTVPGAPEVAFDEYLRVDDYYGVDEGPYTLLALTPPVPGNPLPVPSVGVWNDLHVMANRMAKKIIDQAARQKDVIGYRSSSADDAEEIRNAGDGEMVAVDDPDAVRTYSFGGQQNSNEAHLQSLHAWFNMMAGNPQQLGGTVQAADSATGAAILQQNASVGLEDMKNLVYRAAAEEARKRAWYFHTDPLINVPLVRREQTPPQFTMGPTGPIMVSPARTAETQVMLTPEARRGEFMDFAFEIEPESMARQDSATRFNQALNFATKVLPTILTAAQAAMMLGLPFSAKAMLNRMAKYAGIDWLDEVFADPELQMQMLQQMAMGPQMAPSQGALGPQGPSSLDALAQNGQPANLPFNPSPAMEERQQFQSGANDWQQTLKAGSF